MKPRVLVLTLGSRERDGWVNPDLAQLMIRMARDTRFATDFGYVLGCRPFDYARNKALAQGRDGNYDWLIQFDNDICPAGSPLDLIAHAPADADVIGCRYGITDNVTVPDMFPKRMQFTGNFEEPPIGELPGGCLCIRSSVWRLLPKGPWFQLGIKPGSELLEFGIGEDQMFDILIREHGMKTYLHKVPAPHFHTQDITRLAMSN